MRFKDCGCKGKKKKWRTPVEALPAKGALWQE